MAGSLPTIETFTRSNIAPESGSRIVTALSCQFQCLGEASDRVRGLRCASAGKRRRWPIPDLREATVSAHSKNADNGDYVKLRTLSFN